MDDSEEGGPVSSFQSLAAEGDILYKQGDLKKAIEAYSKALQQRPTDKNILVQRSRCYLQVNDPDAALKDAETAIAEDKDFFKARLQKAEALYAKGDFEMALVFYHRGHLARPEIDEFRLGIQKASEAIENSIGDPTAHKLRVPVQPSADHRAQTAHAHRNASPAKQKQSAAVASASPKKQATSARATRPSGSADASTKTLLGELYADKEYLQKFFEDKDMASHPNTTVKELVQEGLRFLESRTDFWRQQKPVYARKKEASRLQEKVKQAHRRQDEQKEEKERERAERLKQADASKTVSTVPYIKAPPNNSDAAIAKFIKDNLASIQRAQEANNIDSALKAAKLYQNTITNMTFPTKDQALCDIYHLVGILHFQTGNIAQSLLYHNKEQALARQTNQTENLSRALGDIGRCYVRQKKYDAALEAWLEKLPLASNALERVWLRNDMGRCYLEMDLLNDALAQGEAARADALTLGDKHWQMTVNVLLGQVHDRTGDQAKAQQYYKEAHQLATALADAKAIASITKVMSGSAGAAFASSSSSSSATASNAQAAAQAAASPTTTTTQDEYMISSSSPATTTTATSGQQDPLSREGSAQVRSKAGDVLENKLIDRLKTSPERRSSEGISLLDVSQHSGGATKSSLTQVTTTTTAADQ